MERGESFVFRLLENNDALTSWEEGRLVEAHPDWQTASNNISVGDGGTGDGEAGLDTGEEEGDGYSASHSYTLTNTTPPLYSTV